MSKEAMKLALYALEDNFDIWTAKTKAITALREALAEQPAQQEPVAAECNFVGTKEWGRCSIEHHNLVQSEPHKWPGYQTRLLYTSHQPAQQEPVQLAATITITQRGSTRTIDNHFEDCVRDWPDGEYKLYTSPPAQRTWVGLTDEEIAGVVSLAGFAPDWVEAHIAIQIVRVLEAKLKEKNK